MTAKSKETTELPIIDWELCVTLANNKTEIAQEILSLVIEQLPQDLQTIQQAFHKKDYPELLRYVHKLHGALCYSGLPRLKQVIVTLESLLKKKIFDDARLSLLLEEVAKEAKEVLSSCKVV